MIATVMLTIQAAATPPQPQATCTAALTAAATPPGWADGASVAEGGRLTPGRAARVALAPGARFAATPAKPAAAAGASVSFAVPRAGRWRVSLDSGVWIDVVRGTATIASVAHGHGDACSGVRKRVDFDLAAGRYVLQLSGDRAASVRVMVAPA